MPRSLAEYGWLLIAIVRGKMPDTSVILVLLADIYERLESFDPERK